eukprot:CAMPEP_0182464248 /NCGR_PEP_ID=MMETSP1319-20130603/8430_1 /TAXON_ID=172717 /ORGANISM="Bolidomonas pacifica, Strain RCC208" /LENGTH=255 /DNA_ID=CAMNT_0024663881 /DNA_START=74 /DNA_END=838 /DNA_ORIENTATION=-
MYAQECTYVNINVNKQKDGQQAGTGSGVGGGGGPASVDYVDKRPLLKKTPQKYPEIVFDTYYLSSFPYSVERPLPPSSLLSIHNNLNSLLSTGLPRKEACLTVGNYHGLSRGRVEAIDYLVRKRQRIRDQGGEIYEDLEEHVESSTLEHAKGCQLDGLEVRPLNDFSGPHLSYSLSHTPKAQAGFVVNEMTDAEVEEREINNVKSAKDEEALRRRTEAAPDTRDDDDVCPATDLGEKTFRAARSAAADAAGREDG